MNADCGCCEGIEVVTPEPVDNRPGLSAISYRVGTHATFLETMMARLPLVEAGPGAKGEEERAGDRPLARLGTRDPADPSIALLDAWATVADVLTFYQERIANEGYLRTATERLSVVELGRLVGYEPRPGVAASTYLAFSMDDGYEGEIPAGTRAQSLPKPGETPQAFETSEALHARAEWNTMRPRLTKVQQLVYISSRPDQRVHLAGIGLNLRRGDVLVVTYPSLEKVAYSAVSVEEDTLARRTSVELTRVTVPPVTPPAGPILGGVGPIGLEPSPFAGAGLHSILGAPVLVGGPGGPGAFGAPVGPDEPGPPENIPDVIDRLLTKPGPAHRPPRHPAERTQSLAASFKADSNASFAALAELRPELGPLFRALRTLPPRTEPGIQVHVMRVSAPPYGYNALAPARRLVEGDGGLTSVLEPLAPACDERQNAVYLDTAYPGVVPGDHVVVVNPHRKPNTVVVTTATEVATKPRTAYGISARATRLQLVDDWWALPEECGTPQDPPLDAAGRPLPETEDFKPLRDTIVYTQSEQLSLAEVPNSDPIQGKVVEMDALYDGLEPGRWLLLVGERSDIPGFVDGELVMLSGVRQLLREPAEVVVAPASAGAPAGLATLLTHAAPVYSAPSEEGKPAPFTELTFENALLHKYKRGTVVIHGNVVHATQGETRSEVLGSGDASRPLQWFELSQGPLTHVSSPTPAGAASTLEVRVNGVRWHEVQSIASLGPTARAYVTRTGDDGKTRVIGGTGENGARFDTGVENVTAVYRTGIGVSGNVAAEQISLLMTHPLGVRGVINPLPARGGADRESRDLARENAPLAVMALDRLVSVADYAHFARTFAGVGKATAERSTEGGSPVVRVVIAGTTETPIDASSDVHRNLLEAYHRYGSPSEPVVIEPHRPVLLFLSAKIRVWPEYDWINVEPKIRAVLLYAFGFERRKLGEDVFLSEIIAAIHRVREVDHVDVDAFGSIRDPTASPAPEAPVDGAAGGEATDLLPARIAEQVTAQVEAQAEAGPAPSVDVHPTREIAYFTPAIPETLVLMELTP